MVRRADGSQARVYSQASTEPLIEDFGTAELRNGRADVALAADFDELVQGSDYRVFLTEVGDAGGLYVARKGSHRFEVRSRAAATANGGAAVNGTFDYRVVARLKGERGRRLERLALPDVAAAKAEPKRPEPPKLPTTPNPARSLGALAPESQKASTWTSGVPLSAAPRGQWSAHPCWGKPAQTTSKRAILATQEIVGPLHLVGTPDTPVRHAQSPASLEAGLRLRSIIELVSLPPRTNGAGDASPLE